MNPVVVIGAELAGISSACDLTGLGYDVTVAEREELSGGRSENGGGYAIVPIVPISGKLAASRVAAYRGESGR